MGRMTRTTKPSSTHTGVMRAYLAKLGVDPAVAKEIVTMRKTREQISADLVAYIRQQSRGRV